MEELHTIEMECMLGEYPFRKILEKDTSEEYLLNT